MFVLLYHLKLKIDIHKNDSLFHFLIVKFFERENYIALLIECFWILLAFCISAFLLFDL